MPRPRGRRGGNGAAPSPLRRRSGGPRTRAAPPTPHRRAAHLREAGRCEPAASEGPPAPPRGPPGPFRGRGGAGGPLGGRPHRPRPSRAPCRRRHGTRGSCTRISRCFRWPRSARWLRRVVCCRRGRPPPPQAETDSAASRSASERPLAPAFARSGRTARLPLFSGPAPRPRSTRGRARGAVGGTRVAMGGGRGRAAPRAARVDRPRGSVNAPAREGKGRGWGSTGGPRGDK
jgi:hypothetical protein